MWSSAARKGPFDRPAVGVAAPRAWSTGPDQWEVHGVGRLDPQLVGGAGAINRDGVGTKVIGTWAQGELTDLIGAPLGSGFEVDSVRRLDTTRVAG